MEVYSESPRLQIRMAVAFEQSDIHILPFLPIMIINGPLLLRNSILPYLWQVKFYQSLCQQSFELEFMEKPNAANISAYL